MNTKRLADGGYVITSERETELGDTVNTVTHLTFNGECVHEDITITGPEELTVVARGSRGRTWPGGGK